MFRHNLTRWRVKTMEQIQITGEWIKLDALLKFANLVSSGGEAKIRIANGEVLVNDAVCTMRGKKIRVGDRIQLEEQMIEIIR